MHFIRKLMGTSRILFLLGMARTFGKYEHTVWNAEVEFVRYRWRGETWIIPTKSVEGSR